MEKLVKKIAKTPVATPIPKKPIPKHPPPDNDLLEAPEVEEVVDPNDDLERSLGGSETPKRMPDELSPEKYKRQLERDAKLAELRQKQLSEYQPEPGWHIIKIVEYDNTDDGFKKSVEKELVFYQKIQPQLEHQIISRPYIGIIVRKGKPKSYKK